MTTQLTVLGACLMLAAQVFAQNAPASTLYERRLAIIKGSPLPGATAPAGAASPASAAAAAAAAAQTDPAASAPHGPLWPGGLGAKLKDAAGPPTGVPLNTMKKLDSPGIGIELPTAGSAASQASGTRRP